MEASRKNPAGLIFIYYDRMKTLTYLLKKNSFLFSKKHNKQTF